MSLAVFFKIIITVHVPLVIMLAAPPEHTDGQPVPVGRSLDEPPVTPIQSGPIRFPHHTV